MDAWRQEIIALAIVGLVAAVAVIRWFARRARKAGPAVPDGCAGCSSGGGCKPLAQEKGRNVVMFRSGEKYRPSGKAPPANQ